MLNTHNNNRGNYTSKPLNIFQTKISLFLLRLYFFFIIIIIIIIIII